MSDANWTISGQYMESCNCQYLCPCIFTNPQGPASQDHCIALMVYRIDRGRIGETVLDRLKFALVIRSGEVMADGGWIFGVIVDAAADDAQRAALGRIAGGEAGGIPARIRDNLVSDFRGIEVHAIDFDMDGLDRRTRIGDLLSYAIKGVASRLGNGEPFYLENTAHPANTRLALARTERVHLDAFGLSLDLEGIGNNGHYAPFRWSG